MAPGPTPDSRTGRLICLDVFRGIAVAGMILVNNPGSRMHVPALLRHAGWHGCTAADLVFPFFLFICGTSLALWLGRLSPESKPWRRVLRRSAVLFAAGILLNGFSLMLHPLAEHSAGSLATLRIMGVLQRISLAYLLAVFVVSTFGPAGQWKSAAGILLAYWAALLFVPVPGHPAGSLSPEGNAAAWIDRLILTPAHMYRGGPFDPEGLAGTPAAAVTVLAGWFAGRWIKGRPRTAATSLRLAGAALGLLAAGAGWNLLWPINKALWTGSYVVFTAGWALLCLAGCFEVVEVRGCSRLGRPFEVMGRNAFVLFIASGVLVRILQTLPAGREGSAVSLYSWIYQNAFAGWAGPGAGSLIFSAALLAAFLPPLAILYRRGWFVTV